MNIETIIAEKVHALPITKQTKVLEFVEELENVDLMEQSDEKQNKSSRFSFIGIGESATGDISTKAEEILEKEITRRSGWTLKDELVD